MGVELTKGSSPFGAELRTSTGLLNPVGCWYLCDNNMAVLTEYFSIREFFDEAIKYIAEHHDLEETMVALASKVKVVNGYPENWHEYGYSKKSVRLDLLSFKPNLAQSGFLNADKFSIESVELTHSDFINVLEYFLTNTNLEVGDFRIDFIRKFHPNFVVPTFRQSWHQTMNEVLKDAVIDSATLTTRKANLFAIVGLIAMALTAVFSLLDFTLLFVVPFAGIALLCVSLSIRDGIVRMDRENIDSFGLIPKVGDYPNSYVFSILVPPSHDLARNGIELQVIHRNVKQLLDNFGFRLISVRSDMGHLHCIIDASSSTLRVSEEGLIYPKVHDQIPFVGSNELLDEKFFRAKIAQFCCRVVPTIYDDFHQINAQVYPTIGFAYLKDVRASWRESAAEMDAIWAAGNFDVFDFIDFKSKNYETYAQAISEIYALGKDLDLQFFSIEKNKWTSIPIHPTFDDPNFELKVKTPGTVIMKIAI